MLIDTQEWDELYAETGTPWRRLKVDIFTLDSAPHDWCLLPESLFVGQNSSLTFNQLLLAPLSTAGNQTPKLPSNSSPNNLYRTNICGIMKNKNSFSNVVKYSSVHNTLSQTGKNIFSHIKTAIHFSLTSLILQMATSSLYKQKCTSRCLLFCS